MRPNLLLKTLRDMCGSILAWGIGLAILAAVVVYFFDSVRDDETLKSLDAIVQRLSPILRAFIGGDEVPSITNFEGFMKLEFFGYLPLLLAIFAIVEGSATIALEEERRTIDVLMAQPISRWRVVVEKFAAIVVGACVIATLTGLSLVVATRFVLVAPPWYRMMLATANAVPLALVVGALSLLGSCVLRRRRHAVIVGATFLAASFFLNVLGHVVEPLRPWRKLSVFYAYSESPPLTGAVITPHTTWLFAATILLVVAAVLAYQRKDLAA